SLTVASVVANAPGTPPSSPTSWTPPARIASVAPRIRSSAASTRFSRKITTGSTTTSKMTLPIHHKTMLRPSLSSGRRLVRHEDPAEDPGQRHHRRAEADGQAAGRGGGRDLLRRLAALDPFDPVLHVRGEVAHEHGRDVGDHAPAVLRGGPGELQVLGH